MKQVYIALDSDAMSESISHAEKIRQLGIEACIVELEDSDPSDLGFETMKSKIQNCKNFSFDQLIRMKVNAKPKNNYYSSSSGYPYKKTTTFS